MTWSRLAIVWTLGMLLGCWIPTSWMPEGPAHLLTGHRGLLHIPLDKLVHGMMFLGFGVLWTLAGRRMVAVIGAGLALALVTELGQAIPMINRTPDLPDGLADMAGLGLGLLMALVIPRLAGLVVAAARTGVIAPESPQSG